MSRPAVLVLGGDGMLGHIIARRLGDYCDVSVTSRHSATGVIPFDILRDLPRLRTILQKLRPGSLVVNGTGVLAAALGGSRDEAGRRAAILVNGAFPHFLAEVARECGLRVLHVSTDAVFPRTSGAMTEVDVIGPTDLYGLSKAAGELDYPHCITVRCSIIGPPAAGKSNGLWAWVVGQKEGASIEGFVDQHWSGATTFQFSELCRRLVEEDKFESIRSVSPIHHLAPNPKMSKYELLQALAEQLRPDLQVRPAQSTNTSTRFLVSSYKALNAAVPTYATWGDAISATARFASKGVI